MTKSIAVVGAGITGAFAAYFLSSMGNRVAIVDPDDEQRRASFNNPGGINPLHGPGIPGVMSRLAMQSYRAHMSEWPTIKKLSGTDFNGRVVSRLFVALTAEDEKQLRMTQGLYQRAPGFSAEWLEGDRLRAHDPRIGAKALGGLWTRGNAVVDPGRYNRAVIDAACARGAERISARATGLVARQRRVHAVLTDSKELACDEVVFATGAWVDWIRAEFGLALPVRPVRGELLLAELESGAPVHDVTWKRYGVYHHSEALFWFGGTFDEGGFDCSPTSTGEREIVEGVASIMPDLTRPVIRRRAAGLRPMTPDGMPIVGRMPGCENAWLALGGGSKGMLLSSGIGKAVADMAANGVSCSDLDFLAPERFPGVSASSQTSPAGRA